MKKILLLISATILISTGFSNCSTDDYDCGTHNGKTLYKGPKGGCYYYNGSDNKTYVDRSLCNC